jgi:ABC-type transporter Mla subunit MlaD
MRFPITSIAKLLMQIAVLTPAVNDSIDKIRQLIDSVRKRGSGAQDQLDDLKRAMELQDTLNKEMNDQLKLINSVLENVQKSLKILGATTAGIGLIALVALIVAVVK